MNQKISRATTQHYRGEISADEYDKVWDDIFLEEELLTYPITTIQRAVLESFTDLGDGLLKRTHQTHYDLKDVAKRLGCIHVDDNIWTNPSHYFSLSFVPKTGTIYAILQKDKDTYLKAIFSGIISLLGIAAEKED